MPCDKNYISIPIKAEQVIKRHAQRFTFEVVKSDLEEIMEGLGGEDRQEPCIIVPDHIPDLPDTPISHKREQDQPKGLGL